MTEPIGFDLETKPADELFLSPKGEFIKIGAYTTGMPDSPDGDDVAVTTDMETLIKELKSAPWNYSHSGMTFDHLALAWHHSDNPGQLWDELTKNAVDTEILERLRFPPMARDTGGSVDKYGLDASCERNNVPGKTAKLTDIARKHGGYENIPEDDPEYLDYVKGDVRAAKALVTTLPGGPGSKGKEAWYARREHRVASLNGRMTLNGVRVDIPLLEERISEGEQRKREALESLRDEFDLPLGRFEWTGRGKDKVEKWEEFDSPLATLEGRKWLISVWDAFGINNPPVTETGRLATGADALRPIAESPVIHPDLKHILEQMMIVTTTRTVYQTAKDHLAEDGRVHPLIVMRQASGRSSVTSPGLTVFGKRGGRHREREVFIPKDGYVFVSIDLNQIDMRGIAGHCQDPRYMELFGFNDDGTPKDVHQENALLVFGEEARTNKSCRDRVKPIGHGANYGLGQTKMIAAGHDPAIVRKFFEIQRTHFTIKEQWTRGIRDIAASGQFLDNGFGRKMRPDPARAYTQGPALMGQGTAADLLKECGLRLIDAEPRMRDFMLVSIHDEYLFEFPEKNVKELTEIARDAMTFVWRGVPILCDVSKPGKSWGEVSAK